MSQKKSQRIFLIEWTPGEKLGLSEVAKELEKQSHKIIYWTGTGVEREVSEKDFPGVIRHESADAVSGIPVKGIDASSFAPPGEDLIRRLYETESLALTMMNKKYKYLGVSERKQIYYEMVRYWHGVLTALKPDVVIHSDIPHTIFDFIIFSLSELLKIKTIMFERNVYFDRLMLMNDFQIGNLALLKALNDNRSHNHSVADLREDMQKFYKFQMADADPRNIQKLKKRFLGREMAVLKLKMVWKSLIDLTFFKKTFDFIFGDNLKKEYEGVASPADLNKPFIYVALNFQPERTTSPQGGVFVNQILMLEILSASIPPDWQVYVKEHPLQWMRYGTSFSNYRYKGFYKSIARISKTRLVSMSAKTHDLIRNSRAVATVGGSAAWEAVLRSKPGLVFGFPWYFQCPGIFKVSDADSCKAAIAKIKGGFMADQSQIINYLVALDQNSFRACTDVFGMELSGISTEENIRNLSQALISELETMS